MNRILIIGPSGAGSTTLGEELAHRLGIPHLDSDDYIWMPDDPPFCRKRNTDHRRLLLETDLAKSTSWVVSGQVAGWGNFIRPLLDLAVYLSLPAAERLARIEARELVRIGIDRIGPGGDLRKYYLKYRDWAADYETGGPAMRSRTSDEAWLATLQCPVCRLESADAPVVLAGRIIESLQPRQAH